MNQSLATKLKLWNKLPTKVQGIPCYYEVAEGCVYLYDRKGYEAKWLHSKISDRQCSSLIEEYKNYLENNYKEF